MQLQTKREKIKFCALVSVLVAFCALAVSTRYLAVGGSLDFGQKLFFYVYTAGQLFSLAFILNLVVVLIAGLFRSKKIIVFATFVVNLFYLTTIVSDTYVYQLYRFHLNWAMVDLFVNGGSEVIHFSFGMWLEIALLVCGILVLIAAILYIVLKWEKRIVVWPFAVGFVVCFLAGNLTYALASASEKTEITWMAEYVPWARPLTMNRFLTKHGLIVKNKNDIRVATEERTLSYPRELLKFGPVEKKRNIVFLVIDSLRSDMLTEEIMPNLWNISRNSIKFNNHFSSGNSTRAGIFGLFYGLPPSYWHSALRGNVPSAFITALQENGYAIEAFASARLTSPEFDKTVFASVPNLRVSSQGESAWERDLDSIADFESWLKQKPNKPFFAFLFLDNVHAYNMAPDRKPKFIPYWKEVNHLELSNDSDPTEYFNLYKNAVSGSDDNIGRIWEVLKASGVLDDTIVVITSDHGEEFNDNKGNFWGHNSNFTDAQIKIPLVIHWPGRLQQEISHLTTAYDITPTLMQEVLKCINNVSDYSIGNSLWTPKKKEWFVSGSYQNSAIIEVDRVVIINEFGRFEFRDKNYLPSKNQKRDAELFEAIELFSKYR